MRNPRSETYRFGEFLLDAGQRTLTGSRNQPIPLTAKALEALLYLVRNAGIVVNKGELMKAIWPDTIVEENNLNQSISALRRALGEGRSENRYIATIPGQGYRFVAEVTVPTAETETAIDSSMKIIAVLPFKPLVEEYRDAALEMGMADTLIARLSNIDVIVRPISSVRQYCDLNQDPLQAGRELEVESVLDGSIQRWGDQVRVNARLVDVSTGRSLWAGTFDRRFKDIFDIQDEISLAITDALMVSLLGSKRSAVLKRSTNNAEAHELYLKGRYHWFSVNPDAWEKSRQCFEQALEKDPNYALAYSGLADALIAWGVFMPPNEAFPKAKSAAERAVELDASLAEAWCSTAAVKYFYEWDWDGAENDCRQSIALNPRYALVHDLYSICLLARGRFEESIRQARMVCELEPQSGYFHSTLGSALYIAGRYDEAEAQLLKGTEIDPQQIWSHIWLVDYYEQMGMYPKALHHRQTLMTLFGNHELVLKIDQEVDRSSYQDVLRLHLDGLRSLATQRYVSPLDFASIHVRLDEPEPALDWLEKAFAERTWRLNFLNVSPTWKSLHDNPRFLDLRRRMGLSS